MNNAFSPYLDQKRPLLEKLIARLSGSFDFASVLATDVRGTSIDVDRHDTSVRPSDLSESGFVIRVHDGTSYSEYATDRITKADLDSVVEKVKSLAKTGGDTPAMTTAVLKEEGIQKTFIRKNRGEVLDTGAIIDRLRGYVTKTMNRSDAIVNVRTGVETSEISKLYLSNKNSLTQYYTWTATRAFVLTRKADNTKYAFDGMGDDSLKNALESLGDMLEKTADIALRLLDSTPPEPGTYTVITDPSITGLIAHEAFGHGVELDMFVKDRAMAKDYMDKPVASPLVTMHDGAAAVKSAASYFFDDDGVLAQDTKIIDQGILKSGISDAQSAMQLGLEPTGNGRRETFDRKSYSRMTNTFFAPGKSDLSAMIKSVKHGYLIAQTNNGMEDPKNWGIQCTAHYGEEIKDGELTGRIVSPVVLSGHVVDLLKSISAVSKDFRIIGSGSCGKGYKEWVRVSDGGPYLKAQVKFG